MILEVLDGGLLTTVQDAGRPDWTHLGVPVAGAADPWSHAVANLLVGNGAADAALEITLLGPALRATDDGLIALAGADLGARIDGGRRLIPGRSHRIAAGETIRFEPGEAGGAGARATLAVPGGVDVPTVLGSRSTCLAGGFGGVDGRPLRPGDVIKSADPGGGSRNAELVWPEGDESRAGAGNVPAVLRVLPGPAPAAFDALVGGAWRVAAAADRVGVRLEGATLPDGAGGETVTHGVRWGAIQVPANGRPIVLSVDHQTTGGYRVVAIVIAADRPVLGQLRPGDEVHLVATDAETALAALRARHDRLSSGAAALREAAAWEHLAGSAGG
jgi:biotin-dependent carboxylase-like uncharacterized protein